MFSKPIVWGKGYSKLETWWFGNELVSLSGWKAKNKKSYTPTLSICKPMLNWIIVAWASQFAVRSAWVPHRQDMKFHCVKIQNYHKFDTSAIVLSTLCTTDVKECVGRVCLPLLLQQFVVKMWERQFAWLPYLGHTSVNKMLCFHKWFHINLQNKLAYRQFLRLIFNSFNWQLFQYPTKMFTPYLSEPPPCVSSCFKFTLHTDCCSGISKWIAAT